MSNTIVHMKGINKSFRGVQVLFDIHFDLRENEVLGLVGKNGAGKSTLMQVLFGVLPVDSGTIEVFGAKRDQLKHGLKQDKNIAMIFQEFSLIPTMKVHENIFLHNLPKGRAGFLNTKRSRQSAHEILSGMLHVDIDPDEIVRNLSVAMKQTVEIAKALSEKKKIIIMDEPTSALTSEQVEHLFNVIKKLKSQGISVIFISHNLRQIFEICDRITVIKDGRNVLTSETDRIDLDTVVESITGGVLVKKEGSTPVSRTVGRAREPLLKVEDLYFGTKVRGVSFELFPGEVLGIAGLIGSGRTELLETVFGINHPEKGSIFLRGKEVEIHTPERALQNGIILIPDERQLKGLILSHTVMDNMALNILDKIKRGLFTSNKKSRIMADKLVSNLKIVSQGVEVPVSSLSGGNQQKVVFSRTFARGSTILLLDDPTLGIDIETKHEIGEMIKEYVSQGENAAVLVSSELEVIVRICSRVLVLKDGKIVHEIVNDDENVITEGELVTLVQRVQ
jgi:ribose transport system ATP-binding protein